MPGLIETPALHPVFFIDDKTATIVKNAGANILVSGSFIFSGQNKSIYKERIASLR